MEGEEENQENNEQDYEILNEDYPSCDLNYKIIIIGNSNVGKSCLSTRATKNIFLKENQLTIGLENFSFIMRLRDKCIRLEIWDTCGQEAYRALIRNYYKNSVLAIIVYAIDE